jgi:hypothetical protein
MVPTSSGFIWSTPALVVGDAALLILLSGIAALWLTTAFSKQDIRTQDIKTQATKTMEST